MSKTWWSRVLLGTVLVAGVAACSNSPTDPPVVEQGITVSGLNFKFTGATLTTGSGALPTATAGFVAPVVSVNRAPTSTTPATISIGAAEPFQTVLVQPVGSSSYARVFLPAPTTLIQLSVVTAPTTGVVATSVTIAVANGTRTSAPSGLALVALGN